MMTEYNAISLEIKATISESSKPVYEVTIQQTIGHPFITVSPALVYCSL